ncbi:cell envelope integrity protein TolA [Legionella jordanis]|uniref:TolA colicin import membrane protein n=1 Tax=Legionella jordanis TaxID=456 RepID=A0A0W0VBA1_9GAMM|nr:cell envelope integrity protein TolA [Legionella jordanis]KTD17158.1 TolA colicin import membrane protein [Legionella jordanis]RMX03282.1 cell envelope integrity protein TolA [Legionella jordanis]RMX18260.1 cell envelope integrity protein TolA [Legionella jordanis]VEH12644.1 TolA colicin import membrane protein [Legionella jordanis]HAT8713282.1 cell envelope integrity protein TolA [Legionella jordanis]
MIREQSYRKAFYIALGLHLFLALVLLLDPSMQQSASSAKTEIKQDLPVVTSAEPPKEIVKAVSLDNQEVMKTVNQLKQEQANKLKAEQARQQALVKQAEAARQARLQEQQRLAKLKEEAESIAIARKKQVEEEQRKLKELALKKELEAKRLQDLKAKQEELKKKQEEEAAKLEQLKKKQLEEKLKADHEKLEKEKANLVQARKEKEEKEKAEREKAEKEKAAEMARAEKAKAELAEKRRQAAAQQAAEQARNAQIASEVDKYKSMIVNAISRQWILPDNVSNGLSSQFRIRLAPDGAVLEVTLTRSSGDPVLDRSAQTAIYKASPLPVPSDPATFDIFRDISLTVRPENVRG